MGLTFGTALGTALGTSLGLDLCVSVAAPVATPAAILAAGEQKAWFRADQGITLNGANVSGWGNIWGNGNLTQGTAASQPLYTASALNGRPALTAIANTKAMTGTMSSGIAIGQRMYMWCYAQATSIDAAIRHFATVGSGTNGFLNVSTTPANWRAANRGGGLTFATVDTLIAVDTSPHLFEVGLTEGGTDQVVVSGTGVSGTALNAIDTAPVTTLQLFTVNLSANQAVRGHVFEFVAMTGLPTAQQKTDMRAYFASRYGAI